MKIVVVAVLDRLIIATTCSGVPSSNSITKAKTRTEVVGLSSMDFFNS